MSASALSIALAACAANEGNSDPQPCHGGGSSGIAGSLTAQSGAGSAPHAVGGASGFGGSFPMTGGAAGASGNSTGNAGAAGSSGTGGRTITDPHGLSSAILQDADLAATKKICAGVLTGGFTALGLSRRSDPRNAPRYVLQLMSNCHRTPIA